MTSDIGSTSDIQELSDSAAILTLAGEIDMATAPNIIPRFQSLADRGLTDVIIDATKVSFIDSTGIHTLMEGRRIIFEKGSRLLMVASTSLQRVLDMVRLSDQFEMGFATVEEAKTALGVRGRG